jgi:hypothetical protein
MPHFVETSDQRLDEAPMVELKHLPTTLDLNSNETNSDSAWEGVSWDNDKPPPMIYFDDSDLSDIETLSNEHDYEFRVLEPKDKKNLRNNPYLYDVESLIPKLEKLKKEFKPCLSHPCITRHRCGPTPSDN